MPKMKRRIIFGEVDSSLVLQFHLSTRASRNCGGFVPAGWAWVVDVIRPSVFGFVLFLLLLMIRANRANHTPFKFIVFLVIM